MKKLSSLVKKLHIATDKANIKLGQNSQYDFVRYSGCLYASRSPLERTVLEEGGFTISGDNCGPDATKTYRRFDAATPSDSSKLRSILVEAILKGADLPESMCITTRLSVSSSIYEPIAPSDKLTIVSSIARPEYDSIQLDVVRSGGPNVSVYFAVDGSFLSMIDHSTANRKFDSRGEASTIVSGRLKAILEAGEKVDFLATVIAIMTAEPNSVAELTEKFVSVQ